MMQLLQHRLRQHGYEVYRLDYSAVFSPVADTIERLQSLVDSINTAAIHFIGFSLGGLLLYYYFQGQQSARIEKTILLGSPIQGSRSAQRAAKLRLGRHVLGYSPEYGLLGDLPGWPVQQPMTMIAGNRGFGLGQCLLGGLPDPNDGTVAVRETQGQEVTRHIVLPVSHTGLLFNQRVSNSIVQELQTAS